MLMFRLPHQRYMPSISHAVQWAWPSYWRCEGLRVASAIGKLLTLQALIGSKKTSMDNGKAYSQYVRALQRSWMRP